MAYFNGDIDDVSTALANQNLSDLQPQRKIESSQKSERNPQLFNLVNSVNYPSAVTYVTLQPYDEEYSLIMGKITNQKNFKVDSIEKVVNPYLENAYQLKKEQKGKDFPNIEERLLFHGTKKAHIDAICQKNFNWRLCQTHKFGKGVSFSPNSTYASVYSDKNVYNKVMLVAKVMIGKSCIGNRFMILPTTGCDTSQKDAGIVIVKFEDHEFYPLYKINYHVLDEKVGKRSDRKKKGGASRSQQQRTRTYSSDEDLFEDYFDTDVGLFDDFDDFYNDYYEDFDYDF